MRIVVRIAAARCPCVPSPQPWLYRTQDFWLEAGFGVGGSGALFLQAPAAGLSDTPEHKVESSGGGFNSVNGMTPKCIDNDVGRICAAHTQQAIVRLENMTPVVVFDHEQTRVGRMPSGSPVMGIRCVAETDPVPSPAIHLKNATSWDGPNDCDVVRQRRSEERRVGKECRSRWSPYH